MGKLLDIVALMLLAFVVVTVYTDLTTPVLEGDDYMVINKVYVPDHSEGDDPEIVYDRTILKPFRASWYVRIYEVGDAKVLCSGGGHNMYEATDDVTGVTLSWYVGNICHLDPDQDYLMRTVWVLTTGQVVRDTSNVFHVFPDGSDLGPQPANDNR